MFCVSLRRLTMFRSRRSRTEMTELDKVLSNIIEYKNLLSFLSKNYPKVLEEWKLKIIDKAEF